VVNDDIVPQLILLQHEYRQNMKEIEALFNNGIYSIADEISTRLVKKNLDIRRIMYLLQKQYFSQSIDFSSFVWDSTILLKHYRKNKCNHTPEEKEDGDSFFDMGTSQLLEITPEQMENLKKNSCAT